MLLFHIKIYIKVLCFCRNKFHLEYYYKFEVKCSEQKIIFFKFHTIAKLCTKLSAFKIFSHKKNLQSKEGIIITYKRFKILESLPTILSQKDFLWCSIWEITNTLHLKSKVEFYKRTNSVWALHYILKKIEPIMLKTLLKSFNVIMLLTLFTLF